MAVKRIIDLPTDHNPSANDYIAVDGATTRGTQLADLVKPIPAFVGDTGSGGTKGLVPAPATGDAAAGKVLGSGGGWVLPPSAGALGQCRLAKSGANLILRPLNGNQITIDDANYAIPAAGVSLAATGLTPSTAYFIYAYMNSGTMTLEASTTGHATDTSTGVEIKSGDATRTLVGMARPITGPAFQDTAAQRLVLSWFNRRTFSGWAQLSADRTLTGAPFSEVHSEIRNEFLTWGDEPVSAQVSGGWTVTGASLGAARVSFDGTTAGVARSLVSVNSTVSLSIAEPATALSEGFHYCTLEGGRTGGTNVIFVGSVNGNVSLTTTIRG